MAWMQRMKMRARMLLDRGRAGDRLTAELDHHIEAQTAENIAASMSAHEAARAAALRTFGNRGLVRLSLRPVIAVRLRRFEQETQAAAALNHPTSLPFIALAYCAVLWTRELSRDEVPVGSRATRTLPVVFRFESVQRG